jgi:hypothetical protein
VDACGPAQAPPHEALHAGHDAVGGGLLDLDPIFGDEDEVPVVEKQRPATDLEPDALHGSSRCSG